MKTFYSLLLVITQLSIGFSDDIPSICPTVITKDKWGGRAGTQVEYTIVPIKYVIIHHTVTPTCSELNDCAEKLLNIQSYHMNDLDFFDIAYNFLIASDGSVYEGVGWHRLGSHTYGYNRRSIGIAFIGDFRTEEPTAKQLEAGKNLLQCGVELGELDEHYKLLGARSVTSTESPGMALFREIQKWKGFTRTP